MIKVNRNFILLFLLFLLNAQVFSQGWFGDIYKSDANFFNIVSDADQFYNSDSTRQQTNQLMFRSYIRWKSIWQYRLSASGTPGNMNSFSQAMFDIIGNRSSYCSSSLPSVGWQALGPNQNPSGSGFASDLGMCMTTSVNPIVPNDQEILAGFNDGGIFRTTDGGQTWINVTDGIGVGFPNLGIREIMRDPGNPSVVYAVTGNIMGGRDYGAGVLKSTDGGITWNSPVTIGNFETVVKMAINPNNTNFIVVATNYKIYYSTDAGTTFTQVNGFDLSSEFSYPIPIILDLEFYLDDPNFLFVSTGRTRTLPSPTGDGRVYQLSNITSVTITRNDITPTPAEAYKIETSQSHTTRIYLMAVECYGDGTGSCGSGSFANFYESDNPTGSTVNFTLFSSNSNLNSMSIWKCYFEISPINENVVYIGGYDPSFSRDKCQSFTDTPSSHVDVRSIEIIADPNPPADGSTDHVIYGNDGGIDKSTNGGTSILNINGIGLNTNMFYGVGISSDIQNSNSIYIAGAQDNGFYRFDENGDVTIPFGNDATYIRFDKNDPNKGIGKNLYGNIFFTTDRGITSGTLNKPINETISFNRAKPVIHESNTYFFGFRDLYILNDPYGDYCWTKISGLDNPGNYPIVSFAVTPSNVGKIYTAVENMVWNDALPVEKIINRSSFNGSYTWEDITANISAACSGTNVFRYALVTDIEVNSENESELWISFSGVADQDGIDRVFHSTDYGTTWSDISAGLPRFPVSELVYQNGSGNNKILYAATDVGVFVWDESTLQWSCFSNGLPTCIVNDVEIDYLNGKLIAATLGRGLYSCDLFPMPYSTPQTSIPPQLSFTPTSTIEISTNTIWDQPKYITGDVIIKPGNRLTVKSLITMTPNTKIVVERGDPTHEGAILELQGGSLVGITEKGCVNGFFWKGVEVHGHPTQSQEGLTQQGRIFMDNNSKIEHAEIGVIAGKGSFDSFFDFSYSGGIVASFRSSFLNNKTDVMFLTYQNFLPSNNSPIANRSYFYDTKFKTTELELLTEGITPYFYGPTHVFMIGVTGIKYRLCQFISLSIADDLAYQDAMNRGVGIVSLNSSFQLKGNCPANSTSCYVGGKLKGNIFKNLFYGVYAGSSNLAQTVDISKNHFDQNYHGVFLNGIIEPTIYNNRFNCINYDPDNGYGNDIPYNLHLNQCTGYEVEENVFRASRGGGNSGTPNFPKVNVQISLPGSQPEQIYNNDIGQSGKNGYGIFVQGDANDVTDGFSGLQLLCNDFSIATTPSGSFSNPDPTNEPSTFIYLTQNGKINDNQGAFTTTESTFPAGNTFQNYDNSDPNNVINAHQTCTVSGAGLFDEYNLQNGGNPQFILSSDPHVKYFHHIDNSTFATAPQCYSNSFLEESPDPINYVSKINSCPSHYSGSFPTPTLYSKHKQFLINIQNETKKMDGGNKEDLLLKIYSNASPGLVRNAFISASPYLSDDVLFAAISDKATPLPDGILREILLANSPLSATVWNAVLNRVPTLSPGTINQLETAQTGISERTKLESVIDHYNNFDQEVLYDILRKYIMADTIPGYLDSALNFVENENFYFGECRKAEILVAKKDYSGALSIINQHLLNHPNDAICQMQKLLIEFEQQVNYCVAMDTLQKQKLTDLVDGMSKECAAANMILKMVFNKTLPDERIIGLDTRSMLPDQTHKVIPDPSSLLTLFPNPGSEYAYLEYSGEESSAKLFLELFSIDGKVLQSRVVNSSNKMFFISLTDIPSGSYFVKLSDGEKTIGMKKLIVVK